MVQKGKQIPENGKNKKIILSFLQAFKGDRGALRGGNGGNCPGAATEKKKILQRGTCPFGE